MVSGVNILMLANSPVKHSVAYIWAFLQSESISEIKQNKCFTFRSTVIISKAVANVLVSNHSTAWSSLVDYHYWTVLMIKIIKRKYGG